VDLVHPSTEDEPAAAELYVKLPDEPGKSTGDSTAADTINRLGESGWEVVGYASPMMRHHLPLNDARFDPVLASQRTKPTQRSIAASRVLTGSRGRNRDGPASA